MLFGVCGVRRTRPAASGRGAAQAVARDQRGQRPLLQARRPPRQHREDHGRGVRAVPRHGAGRREGDALLHVRVRPARELRLQGVGADLEGVGRRGGERFARHEQPLVHQREEDERRRHRSLRHLDAPLPREGRLAVDLHAHERRPLLPRHELLPHRVVLDGPPGAPHQAARTEAELERTCVQLQIR